MILAKITDGLGNQLFQYACGLALAIRNNTELKLDTSYYTEKVSRKFRLQELNVSSQIANPEEIEKFKSRAKKNFITKHNPKLGTMLFSNCYVKEKSPFKYQSHIKRLRGNLYLDGYWANEGYFIDHRHAVIENFSLKSPFTPYYGKLNSEIINSESVCVHIRRGDYRINSFFANKTIEYYQKAFDIISKKLHEPKFFIFSDDILWAKNNIDFEYNITFVEPKNEQISDVQELIVASKCKHNIIANSTYSWWIAWLNNNISKLVLAPKIWYNNKYAQKMYINNGFIPKSWKKI